MAQKAKILRRLSSAYNQAFRENLEAYVKNYRYASRDTAKGHCLFYPSFGSKGKCTFLVYGQAVNGWGVEFNLNIKKGQVAAKSEESIAFSNSYYKWNNQEPCPLDWVNIYWSKKSYRENIKTPQERDFYQPLDFMTSSAFFWNITNKVISEFYEANSNGWYRDWASKLVWSNLYKISPQKGNPSEKEKGFQQPLSTTLVKLELDEIQPDYCIVLTNDSWWSPFRDTLKTVRSSHNLSPEIESFETYNNTKIIVTRRRRGGSHNVYVRKILELINK